MQQFSFAPKPHPPTHRLRRAALKLRRRRKAAAAAPPWAGEAEGRAATHHRHRQLAGARAAGCGRAWQPAEGGARGQRGGHSRAAHDSTRLRFRSVAGVRERLLTGYSPHHATERVWGFPQLKPWLCCTARRLQHVCDRINNPQGNASSAHNALRDAARKPAQWAGDGVMHAESARRHTQFHPDSAAMPADVGSSAAADGGAGGGSALSQPLLQDDRSDGQGSQQGSLRTGLRQQKGQVGWREPPAGRRRCGTASQPLCCAPLSGLLLELPVCCRWHKACALVSLLLLAGGSSVRQPDQQRHWQLHRSAHARG